MRLVCATLCVVVALAVTGLALMRAHAPAAEAGVTPPHMTLDIAATNPGPPASALEIVLATQWSSALTDAALLQNAPGCGTPSIATESVLIAITPAPPILGGFSVPVYQVRTTLTWPDNCVDTGEQVIVRSPGAIQINSSSYVFFDAALATPTPTFTPSPVASSVIEIAIDCDLASAGVQSACNYAVSTEQIEVGVVLSNTSGGDLTIGALGFDMQNFDRSRLEPVPGPGDGIDSNPDFNQDDIPGAWMCLPVTHDTNQLAPNGTESRLSCFISDFIGNQLPADADLLLGTVAYDVPPAATPGTAALLLDFVAVADHFFFEIGSCRPVIETAVSCFDAVINLVPDPTATPTPSPTATSAPVAPGIEKVPEGDGPNVDLAVPSANLWICEAGQCDGPGEGALRVVERAINVSTGDQDGDTVPDGLGAYEFDVEYDNLVIASLNPCDIVFGAGGAGAARGPVDELNASAANPDCADDAGAAGNGSCSFSVILENVIHFGCATSGQAPGPTGTDIDLASLLLIPHEDLADDLFPGNDNGVVTVIKDNGCELVDIFGHPVTGSVGGGLTPVCGNLWVTVRILEGDIDLDCDVDVSDQQKIAFRYGTFFGSSLYGTWYDLEPNLHDLDIDIKDLQKVFGRDGSTCQSPIPEQAPVDPPVL